MFKTRLKTRLKSAAALGALCAILVSAASPSHGQVTLGQVDTFEDGTTQGWIVGDPTHPAPPANIATGGPGGSGDNFLQLTSTGQAGPGGRLAVFNPAQWAGDYLASGITFIQTDLNNLGQSDLSVRLLFADPVAGPPSNIAITDAFVLPVGSGWVHAVFAIDPASLIGLLGSPAAALANATEMRIFHNPDPDFPGPPIGIPRVNALLGVDNILAANTAQAVPEPGAAAVLCCGGIAGALLLRNRRRRHASSN